VVEHVAIEWGSALDATGNYGKTVRSARPHGFDVVVTSLVHQATRCLLHGAVAFVEATNRDEPFDTAPLLAAAHRLVDHTRLGPSTRAIVDAAARRGVPWKRLNDESLVQLGYGIRRRLIQSTISEGTSAIAVEIAQDKAATKAVLARAFIPVPDGQVVESEAEAVAALDEIAPPVVLKPLDGNQGKGVTAGVRTHAEVKAAFALAQEHSRRVVIERMLVGNDYRVLVIGRRMVAASRRQPPAVTGDGTRTVRELVAFANEDRGAARGTRNRSQPFGSTTPPWRTSARRISMRTPCPREAARCGCARAQTFPLAARRRMSQTRCTQTCDTSVSARRVSWASISAAST
jgi:cyanophycin synthetase